MSRLGWEYFAGHLVTMSMKRNDKDCSDKASTKKKLCVPMTGRTSGNQNFRSFRTVLGKLVTDNKKKAYCRTCEMPFGIDHGGKNCITRHIGADKHKKNARKKKGQQSLDDMSEDSLALKP